MKRTKTFPFLLIYIYIFGCLSCLGSCFMLQSQTRQPWSDREAIGRIFKSSRRLPIFWKSLAWMKTAGLVRKMPLQNGATAGRPQGGRWQPDRQPAVALIGWCVNVFGGHQPPSSPLVVGISDTSSFWLCVLLFYYDYCSSSMFCLLCVPLSINHNLSIRSGSNCGAINGRECQVEDWSWACGPGAGSTALEFS